MKRKGLFTFAGVLLALTLVGTACGSRTCGATAPG